MPLLRFIAKSQYESGRWAELTAAGRLPSDLDPQRPSNVDLSFWKLDDHGLRLPRIAASFSRQRQHVDALDFVLFAPEFLLPLGSDLRLTKVATPDTLVGRLWHWELVAPTDEGRWSLAREIRCMVDEGTKCRLLKSEVKRYIEESVGWGHLAADAPS